MTDTRRRYDSVFLNSRRESIVLLVGFGCFLFWSVGVSYWLGYDASSTEISRTVLGIPSWVFWGVCVPWIAANLFTFWFAWFFLADDPLGEALDERPADNSEDAS